MSEIKEALIRGLKKDLRRADLSGVKLYGADLSGADLSYADLSGARYNQSTIGLTDAQKKVMILI